MFKTKTKTKTFIFVLEAPRDQDPGLEDYITENCSTVAKVIVKIKVACFLGDTGYIWHQ